MSSNFINVFSRFDNIKAFFSLKDGASGRYPYDREDVFKEVGVESAIPIWPKQIHKTDIAIVTKTPAINTNAKGIRILDTDGLITDVENILLTTVHADCLAVYFFDPVKKVIGLAHAGWRGTAAGIAPKAVKKMCDTFGCNKNDIYAFIGPGISKCCFEVGKEVYDEFKRSWDFIDLYAEEKTGFKYHIDLKAINRRQLEDLGIPACNIEVSPHCTCCEPKLFCSYRRDGEMYRRMGAGICITG